MQAMAPLPWHASLVSGLDTSCCDLHSFLRERIFTEVPLQLAAICSHHGCFWLRAYLLFASFDAGLGALLSFRPRLSPKHDIELVHSLFLANVIFKSFLAMAIDLL